MTAGKKRSIGLLGRQGSVRIPQSDHHRPPATITAGRLAWHPTIPVYVDDC
ncbi:hypothetical protein A3768_5057 (plasmid) [Ralstonia solanacearum]|nr:hypothetical protein A3768_5057 [Ralstonia solanacearum]